MSEVSITAMETVVGALIASAFAFVNLTLSKEQKISEFRQAWIDGLRNDIAVFLACARTFARAVEEEVYSVDSGGDVAHLAISPSKVSDIRYQIGEARYRIRLRLNSSEVNHIELLRLMSAAIKCQDDYLTEHRDISLVLKAIDMVAEHAPVVLKEEWKRVKQGERAFRVARNWITPVVVATALGFTVYLSLR